MEMSDQFHALPTYPGKNTIVPSEEEAGWMAEPVHIVSKRKISGLCWEFNPNYSIVSLQYSDYTI